MMNNKNKEHSPTAALIARAMAISNEAEREKAIRNIRDLRKIYEGTYAEFKAPNGNESLLLDTLGQELGKQAWYAVRTDNFKGWFGDWETVAIVDWLLNTEPVKRLEGTEFAKSDIDLVTQVTFFFDSIGGKVEREGLGTVILDRNGAKSSIGHKIGRAKAITFAAVPEIIKNGKITDHQINRKRRGYDTFVINAPITINVQTYIGEVIIIQKSSDAHYYLHEVETQKKFRSGTSVQAGIESGTPLGTSKLIIGKKLDEVKRNFSKNIDDNGEPRIEFYNTYLQNCMQ